MFGFPFAGLAVKAALVALVVAVVFGYGYHRGNVSGLKEFQAYKDAQAQQAVKTAAAQAETTTKVVTEYIKVKGDTEHVYHEIEKQVPVYVTADADRACAVPVGFVRLHDAAAAGKVPTAASRGDGGAPAAEAAAPGGEGRERSSLGREVVGGAGDGHGELQAGPAGAGPTEALAALD